MQPAACRNILYLTTPLACQDWVSTKAAYGFFSNDRFSKERFTEGLPQIDEQS
ncbi:MAG: hypothetical protein HY537_04720 [Deltaproteobacteria bacterium]|nr:hypothetical protein [Deltaproteobacteria bacterium]